VYRNLDDFLLFSTVNEKHKLTGVSGKKSIGFDTLSGFGMGSLVNPCSDSNEHNC
jgi:hypothetical protein